MAGKFIALYGINNIGKSTQARKLATRLEREYNEQVEYLKYPLYDLEPTGSMINAYLREDNPYHLDETAFQMLQFINRYHYNSKLRATLASGIHVVAEDYWGTGVAWGVGGGVDKDMLLELTHGLVQEDIAVLLDGERFVDAQEINHRHENDAVLIKRVREVHKDLAQEFGWHVVRANDEVEEVHNTIYTIVRTLF